MEKDISRWVKFNYLFKKMEDVYSFIAAREGLSESVFDILYALWEIGDGCTQKEISETYYIKKQTLNSSVKNLEKEGVLRLERVKGRDKRIFLTEKGRGLIESKIKPVVKAEEKAFFGLEEGERRELLRVYEKFIDGLRENAENLSGGIE